MNLATLSLGDITGFNIVVCLSSRGYEFSFGTSLAKVDSIGVEKNCVRQTDKHYVIFI